MGDRERKIAGNIVRGVVVFILVCGLAGGFGRGYADDNYEDSVLNKLGHSHDILLQELSRSLKKIGSLKRENYILAGALKRLRSQKAPQDRQRDDYRRKYDACQTKLDGYRKEYDACR
ncbi:MAG: hypothetical protein ACE5GG_04140, partial [Candidatus Omnitrophota bacterium]